MAAAPPIATVTFDDGCQLEILGMARSVWLDGRDPTGAAVQWGRIETRTEALPPDEGSLRIDRYTRNGELVGIRYHDPAGEPLLLSLRLLKPSGVPLERGAPARDELRLTLTDVDGDPLLASVLYGADDDPEKRLVAAFPIWPRSGSELFFEATRPGQAPLSFRLPNPVAGSSPAIWTAAPLPQTRAGTDWELRLKQVTIEEVPGHGDVLRPETEFITRIAKPDGPWPPVFEQCEGLEAARGTKGSGRLTSSGWGFPVPADEDLFRFRFRIGYGRTYPYPRTDARILLVGEVDPTATKINVLSQHLGFGIDSIEVDPFGKPGRGYDKATHRFEMRLSGKWSSAADRATAEKVLGPWDEWAWAVFLDGSPQAIGDSDSNSWGNSSGGFSGSETFNRSGEWTGSLKPGAKLELGIVRSMPDELVEFTFDRRALTPR